jgi:hypothetical protein
MRTCSLKHPQDVGMLVEDVGAIRRDLSQPREPTLISPSKVVAVRNWSSSGICLILELCNLGDIVMLGDVLSQQLAQSIFVECWHYGTAETPNVRCRAWLGLAVRVI